jgi:hypothetical protein
LAGRNDCYLGEMIIEQLVSYRK